MNVVFIRGRLSSEPRLRILPSGSRLVSYEVTTDTSGASRSSVPVVWFDPPMSTPEMAPGEDVVVAGEIKRRFFRTGGVTQSRTEVVASRVVPTRRAAQARRVVGTVLEALGTTADALTAR